MKSTLEERLLLQALNRKAAPHVVLATFWLELPDSNGSLHFAVALQRWHQPCAILQSKFASWTYTHPELPRGTLHLPDHIFRYIRWKLRQYAIKHVVGIESDENTIEGIPLMKH